MRRFPAFLNLTLLGGTALITLLAPAALLGQGATASIQGTVSDDTGAVLPGVEVTITNTDTGRSRMAITGDQGRYSARELPVGPYQVRAELTGFQTAVRRGITLQVGQEALVNLRLNIGEITEEVVVTGEAPLVNTTSSTLSDVITEVQVHELPLNSRNLTQLSLLTPGVVQLRTAITGGVTQGAPAVRVSIGGARFYQTGFFLDGTDVTDSSRGMGPGGAAGSLFGVETVKEFRVITNNYSAEYSRFSGGIMSMVTKSGTNDFHGSAFWFHRNDNFDATNFFANKAGLENPEFRRHQYGATLGGPVVSDRTFFFSSYEGFREGLGITDTDVVPTTDAKQGIFPARGVDDCSNLPSHLPFSYDTASGKCVAPVNPTARPFLDLYGPPNAASRDGGITADQIINITQPTEEDFFTGKIDHNFSDSNAFFARYTTSFGEKLQPVDTANSHQPFAETATKNSNHYSTIEWKHIYSPHTISTARVGAQRNKWTQEASNPGPLDIGFYADRAMGLISPGDGVAQTGINVDGQNVSNQFSFANDWFLTRGNHDIKLGVLATRHQTNDQTVGRGGGQFFWDSVADFVAGTAFRWRGRNPQDEPRRGVRQTVIGFYVQDDFRWRPNLTLNLGLRYEPTTSLTEVNQRLVNIRGNPQTATTWTFGDPYFENPSKKNFAPRIGFAWDPFSDGKTSIRGGYGIFHITILPFHFSNQIRRSPPLSVAPDIRDSQCSGCVSAQFPSPPQEVIDPPVGTVAFQVAEFTPRQPYAQQWNLSLQRELAGGITMTTAYVGSKGTNLQVQRNVNARFPEILPDGQKLHRTSTPRPNLNFGDLDYWEFSSTSNYHGLNLGLKKRFTEGLQFQAAYTWGRSIDWASRVNVSDIQENSGKFPQDQYDVKGSNRGLSAHQVQQNFNFNYVWEIPFGGNGGVAGHLLGGWQMNGILQLSTGNPETLRLGGTGGTFDWNRDGETSSTTERPTLVPGREQNAVIHDGRNPDEYFDATAFTLHEPGFNGDVGRNVVIGPGISTFDFSLFKNFVLAEETRLQFRAEFFNIFNRTNFGRFDPAVFASVRTESVPCSVYGSTQGDAGCSRVAVLPNGTRDITYRSTAGRITETRTTNRQVQFGLRLTF